MVDENLPIVALAARSSPPASPFPGLVEFDAADVARRASTQRTEATTAAGQPITAVGITNQRASTIVWDRGTGEPIGPALGWQDLRTIMECIAAKEAHGLRLAPNQSATKVAWLLDNVAEARDRDLCFGTLDSWLAWTLSGGALHVTDHTNAAVTGLLAPDASAWSDRALDALGGTPSRSAARRRRSAAKNSGVILDLGTSWAGERDRLVGDDPARPRGQHDHPVGEVDGFGDRVGDEHHRRRVAFAQPGEQMAGVGAGDLVERGERLVEQQHRRGEGERAHEGDALLHASGQLVRVGVGEVGEPDLDEQLARIRLIVAVGRSVDVAEQASVGGDRTPRQQRRCLRARIRCAWPIRAVSGGSPSTSIVPAVGWSSPAIRRSSVVFPLPLGPSSVTTCPAATDRSIGPSASVSPPRMEPNVLATPVTTIAADIEREGTCGSADSVSRSVEAPASA